MGSNTVNGGSIVLGGLNTQLVRGDGSLVNSSIYSRAVMTSATFSATFQNATTTFTYRLLTNSDNTKIVHLYIPTILTVIPVFTQYVTAAAVLPTVIRPSQNIFNLCRITMEAVNQAGTILLTPGGNISFSSIGLTGYAASTSTNNGTPQIQTISYIFP